MKDYNDTELSAPSLSVVSLQCRRRSGLRVRTGRSLGTVPGLTGGQAHGREEKAPSESNRGASAPVRRLAQAVLPIRTKRTQIRLHRRDNQHFAWHELPMRNVRSALGGQADVP